MDLRSTSLSCIFNALVGDTPFGQICPYGHMGIWAYVKKYGQVGYPRKEHQKCNSETLTSGPQDPPFKSYGQQLFSQGKCLVFYIVTKKNLDIVFQTRQRPSSKGKMVRNIQEIKNPGGSNHFEQLVHKVSWSTVDHINHPCFPPAVSYFLLRRRPVSFPDPLRNLVSCGN